MKFLILTTLLFLGTLTQAQIASVDAKNPLLVYCSSKTEVFVQEGFNVNIEEGIATSIEVRDNTGTSTTILLPKANCNVEANFVLDAQPSMGISN